MVLSILAKIYHQLKNSKRLSQILVLLSFLITFMLARLAASLNLFVIVDTARGPLHIHHLVPGIFLLLISGYLGLSFHNRFKLRNLMALLFGTGAALTVDEFSLWLYLEDVYWEREGRRSIDAIIITALVFSITLIVTQARDHSWKHKVKNYIKKKLA